jgi:phospholipid/cholesterol/gamma-HCH transport system substrate-binding protein
MAKQFKSAYANSLAAAFVFIILMLVGLTVVLVGRAQRWFQPVRPLTILLPEEGSLGLREGADVLILGTNVGSVNAIRVNEQGGMEADVSIRRDFSRYVRADSVAVVRRTFGVAGDAYVEISRGNGAPLPDKGASIKCASDQAPTAMVGETLDQIRNEAVPALKELRVAIVEYTRIAQEFRDPKNEMHQVIARVNNIAAALDKGEGLAGRLLKDPTLADRSEALLAKATTASDQLQSTLTDARKLVANLTETADTIKADAKNVRILMAQAHDVLDGSKDVVQDMRRTTAKLPDLIAAVTRTADSLPAMVLQVQDTFRQVGRLVEGAQKSWLVRGYMSPDDPGGRIRPDAVGGDRGMR